MREWRDETRRYKIEGRAARSGSRKRRQALPAAGRRRTPKYRYTVQRMSSLLGIWQFLGCLPILVYGIHPIDCLSLVMHTYCGGDPFSKVDKNSKEWPCPNSKQLQIKTWVPSHREQSCCVMRNENDPN
jgi:hypothetical protein